MSVALFLDGGPWCYDGKHRKEYGDRYLDLLRVRGAATTIDIAKALGVNRVTAFGAMCHRQEQGLVTCDYVPHTDKNGKVRGGSCKDAWWRLL